MKYKVIALIGKAGSGKDTILHELMKHTEFNFNEIISCTTRSPREGEKDGINYYFLKDSEFKDKIIHNQMLEYTNFNNWFYGTSIDSLDIEKINIGVFNPAGIYSLLKCPNIDLQVYFIAASDKKRIMRQLEREKNPDVREIIRRYDADEKDFAVLNFPCLMINNNSNNISKTVFTILDNIV